MNVTSCGLKLGSHWTVIALLALPVDQKKAFWLEHSACCKQYCRRYHVMGYLLIGDWFCLVYYALALLIFA